MATQTKYKLCPRSPGIATLEAAVFAIILLTFGLGLAAFSEYLAQVMTVNEIIERALYNTSLKPLRLESGAESVVVDAPALQAYLGEALDDLENSIAISLVGDEGSATIYFVQGAFAEVNVAEDSGSVLGLIQTPFSFALSRGSASVPQEVLNKTDLGVAFGELISAAQNEPSTALAAVPSALYGVSGNAHRFLGRHVLIGLRVITRINTVWIEKLFQTFGFEPWVYHAKVITLRGEVA